VFYGNYLASPLYHYEILASVFELGTDVTFNVTQLKIITNDTV